MQDRLKTRVWDKKNRVMHYDDFVITSTGYIAKVETDGSFCQTDLSHDENLVPMQCTGIKDKNGKLIFEGDVLSEDDGSKYIVMHDDQFPCFFMKRVLDSVYSYGVWSRVVIVIGNVYENEELLKGV